MAPRTSTTRERISRFLNSIKCSRKVIVFVCFIFEGFFKILFYIVKTALEIPQPAAQRSSHFWQISGLNKKNGHQPDHQHFSKTHVKHYSWGPFGPADAIRVIYFGPQTAPNPALTTGKAGLFA